LFNADGSLNKEKAKELLQEITDFFGGASYEKAKA
jgi:hypothetical protein